LTSVSSRVILDLYKSIKFADNVWYRFPTQYIIKIYSVLLQPKHIDRSDLPFRQGSRGTLGTKKKTDQWTSVARIKISYMQYTVKQWWMDFVTCLVNSILPTSYTIHFSLQILPCILLMTYSMSIFLPFHAVYNIFHILPFIYIGLILVSVNGSRCQEWLLYCTGLMN
jgi:hypothetical protein